MARTRKSQPNKSHSDKPNLYYSEVHECYLPVGQTEPSEYVPNPIHVKVHTPKPYHAYFSMDEVETAVEWMGQQVALHGVKATLTLNPQ